MPWSTNINIIFKCVVGVKNNSLELERIKHTGQKCQVCKSTVIGPDCTWMHVFTRVGCMLSIQTGPMTVDLHTEHFCPVCFIISNSKLLFFTPTTRLEHLKKLYLYF